MQLMREILVFVGESRSQTAKDKGYTWINCQVTGKPVNSAIRLFDALRSVGLDPNQQVFFNLWDDEDVLNPVVPEVLKEMAQDGEIIVAMGHRAGNELSRLGIPHEQIIHPAARGKIASRVLYRAHVKEILGGCA